MDTKKTEKLKETRDIALNASFWNNILFTVMMLLVWLIVWGYYNRTDYMNGFKYKTFEGWIVSHDSYYNPTDGYYHLNMNGEKANGLNCTYYDYYVGTESVMNIVIGKDMNTQVKWSIDVDYGNCVKHQRKHPHLKMIVTSSIFLGICVLLFCISCGALIEISMYDVPNVKKRIGVPMYSTFISFAIIICSGGILLNQNIYLLRNKVNWHFENFEGNIGSYDIDYNDENNQYHLNMIGSNALGFCTFYNYYTGTLEEIKTVIDNELYSSVKWSQISGTKSCVGYKDYNDRYAHFGIDMCILLLSSIWFYIMMWNWKIGMIIQEELDVLIKEEEAREAIDITNVSMGQDQENLTVEGDACMGTGACQTLDTSFNVLISNKLDFNKSDPQTNGVDQIL